MQPVLERILHRAEHSPERVAIRFEASELTYGQMVEAASKVGTLLRASGVNAGDRVALIAEKSIHSIPIFLGSWIAGASIVPVDPAVNKDGLRQMLASVRFGFTDAQQHARLDLLPEGQFRHVCIDQTSRQLPHACLGHLEPLIESQPGTVEFKESREAYVLFTSGSQGIPKGVIGSHASLAHYVDWQLRRFPSAVEEEFSQIAPLHFDFSFKEFLAPLAAGSGVCLFSKRAGMNPALLLRSIAEKHIAGICAIPSLFRAMGMALELPDSPSPESFDALRLLMISGDVLRWEDVRRWRSVFRRNVQLVNLYGPTESIVIKAYYPIPVETETAGPTVPVGRPIDDAEIVICDEEGNGCRSGDAGELVIVSNWIADGYVSGELGGFGTRLHNGAPTTSYRTGDFGRRLADGNIEFVGRRDRQVKLRGHRVELDAVEAHLARHPDLADVAVVIPPYEENPGAVCCFVSRSGRLTGANLRASMQELPPAAIPGQFEAFPSLPLGSTGKVDRAALIQMLLERQASAASNSPQPTGLEHSIARCWGDVLHLDDVPLDRNFFELGGNSLSAVLTINKMRSRLDFDFPLAALFDYPTVRELAGFVIRHAMA